MVAAPAGTRGKRWCFTAYTAEAPQLPEQAPIKYFIYQQEKCPETNRLHWQGFMILDRQMTIGGIKKLMKDNTVHLEITKGTNDEASNYCKKDDTCNDPATRKSYGELPPSPKDGLKGNMWDKIKLDLENTDMTFNEIVQNNIQLAGMHYNNIQRLYAAYRRDRTPKEFTAIAIIGPGGIGKSYYAEKAFGMENCYTKDPSTKWWDGYDGEKVIIINEFYGQWLLSQFLEYCDIRPIAVETKGGTLKIRPRIICFTSHKHPDTWYKKTNPYDAEYEPMLATGFKRRLPDTNIMHCQTKEDIIPWNTWSHTLVSITPVTEEEEDNADEQAAEPKKFW